MAEASMVWGGCFLRMLSRGGMHVVNSGDAIRLSCEFYMENFNLFDNPVLWRKVQHQEEMQINMMGNILEPFESTRRFKVTFVPEPSKYVLGLYITSSGLEDSGNYTCEVNGPQNAVLGFVTNYIFVRAHVETILITQAMNVTSLVSSSSPDSGTVSFTEGQPSLLRCLAFGGYPPPQITLTLDPDDDDISHQFGLTYTAFMSGVRGLRQMQYTTDRWSHEFRVRAEDDGKRIRCTAVVSGIASTSAIAGIRVQYAPIITCETTSAAVGDKNIFVRCEVRARPEVTSLFWLIDVNGTTVAEGDVINEYWTLSMVHEDGVLETNLYLRQVTLSSYREYRVAAENAVAARIKEAFLVEEGCDYDGLYYRDEYSFLTCTHGIGYVQYCPRGTHNSGETKYQPYDEYSSSGFCDVNVGYYASVSYPAPSYPAPSYPAPSYQAQSHPAPSYPAPSYPAPSYPAPSYPAPSYQAQSHPAPSYPAPSYPAPSYPAPSYPAQSRPAPSYPAPSYQVQSYPAQSYSAPSYSAPIHQAPSYPAPSYPAASYQAPSYPAPNHKGYSVPSYSAPAAVGYQSSGGYPAPSSSYSIVRPNYSAPVAQYAITPSRHSDSYSMVYQAPSAPLRHSRGSQGRRMGYHQRSSSS